MIATITLLERIPATLELASASLAISAIFGILISLGVYFAFDLGYRILNGFGLEWVFFVPALLLGIFWLLDVLVVRNQPSDAGLPDFDTADASSGDEGPQLGPAQVFGMMLRNPIIMTIACIEFCSGFLRKAIMQWYPSFAEKTNQSTRLSVAAFSMVLTTLISE